MPRNVIIVRKPGEAVVFKDTVIGIRSIKGVRTKKIELIFSLNDDEPPSSTLVSRLERKDVYEKFEKLVPKECKLLREKLK